MAKHIKNKLSSAFVRNAKGPAKYGDGGGLWLIVDGSGAKRWRFIFSMNGKRYEMGLGGYPGFSLAEARDERDEAQKKVKSSINPIEARRQFRRAEKAGQCTFGQFSDELVEALVPGFRSQKHIDQWRMSLKVYAKPIRQKSISDVSTEDVLGILKPIWQSKAETASRVRGRIERVLDAAKAKGLRVGENPARWKGHLDSLLPKRQKLTRGHFASMPFENVPAFLMKLKKREAVAAKALEFLILTAARTGEVLGATWQEIDLEKKLWTIPAHKMKAGREHRVPLVGRALDILQELQNAYSSEFIFPGTKPRTPLSGMSMIMLLRRMKVENVTVHGFRSSFRDWAGENTQAPREVAEAALAHVLGDATERAYRRRDALDKRRQLMEAWYRYCKDSGASDGKY
ncbi:MAG: integrase arm-type DNA-binding domain-containing protein [Kordiimonadaceae bacterium]|nr:integrase arm-type DNA-binding domain-containing protein [Kordiimonadaceae bacterium]